jgi:deoxyribodipyrimidine photo-lyase
MALTSTAAAVNGKRKATESNTTANKKPKATTTNTDRSGSKDARVQGPDGIALRNFYPPEMSNDRVKGYVAGNVERPIETLEKAIGETAAQRAKVGVHEAVVHWFKSDLRTRDNSALHKASEKAKSKGVPLITLYLISPQDFEAHLISPVKVDFMLRTLAVLKTDLAVLNIPLYVETVEKRRVLPARLLELCEEWGARHLFCNTEYEVDELRREAALVRNGIDKGIAVTTLADTCVVSPGALSSKSSGSQFAVYTPWFRAWCAYLNSNQTVLAEHARPEKNPPSARERFKSLFEWPIPEAPANKQLSAEEKTRFASMWPCGEHEAELRLGKFIDQRIKKYAETRNIPAGNGTAVISIHLASGTLSARTCVREARNANSSKSVDSGNSNIQTWISEVAWRDFYKHVLVHWPFVWYVQLINPFICVFCLQMRVRLTQVPPKA